MTDRRDVEMLRTAHERLIEMAEQDLAEFFASLDMSDPAAVRDLLLDVVPALVNEYGDLAAAVSADWYEQVRPGSLTARTVESVPDDIIAGSTRFLAKDLFTDDSAATLATLTGAMQRHIMYSARETISRNVQLDPDRPRFARVPSGVETCSWCEMLSSRGWVYWSEESAGSLMQFHDFCNCEIVAQFDAEQAHIEGYDPEAMFERFDVARAAWNADNPGRSASDKDIATYMRSMFRDKYTDGGVYPSGVVIPDAQAWRHIMFGDSFGGGHRYGSGIEGITEFPETWNTGRMLSSTISAQSQGVATNVRDGSTKYETLFDDVVVRVIVKSNNVVSVYPLRGTGVFQNSGRNRVLRPLHITDHERY